MRAREHITSLYVSRVFGGPVRTPVGMRRLLSGTASRLYSSTGDGLNHQLLLDVSLGGDCEPDPDTVPEHRFLLTQAAGFTFAAHTRNSFWLVDPHQEMMWAKDRWQGVEPVLELVALSISEPKTIASFSGLVVIGNVIVEGDHQASAIYWSDFDDPRSWIPSDLSMAGVLDLGGGQEILVMAPVRGALRVYTDRAIYDLYPDEQAVLRPVKLCDTADVPFYRNSFINAGGTHMYLGKRTMHIMDG